jgi:hypothetical protein
MKKFWKWFFIILGILVVAGFAFGVTMFMLRAGHQVGAYTRGYGFPGGMMGRNGYFGGMMFGMGWMMIVRGLFSLAILVLAGFGVASLVRQSRGNLKSPSAGAVCANCGKPLAADWKACPHCGTAVPTEAAIVVDEKPQKTKTKAS